MEILVVLKPEEFALLRAGAVAGTSKPHEVLRVVAASITGERAEERPMLFVHGRGFDEELVALLERRPEVASVEFSLEMLAITLTIDADSAPIVSLLVESGVEVTEVFRRDLRVEYMLRQLMRQHQSV